MRWGKPVRILQGIGSGLLGPRAWQGGLQTAALGLALHFFIALSAAAVFYAASRKLSFLSRRFVLWGPLYGIAVFMFMNWVVLPLSAFPPRRAPFSAAGLAISLLTHLFCVGLPIALAVRYFGPQASALEPRVSGIGHRAG